MFTFPLFSSYSQILLCHIKPRVQSLFIKFCNAIAAFGNSRFTLCLFWKRNLNFHLWRSLIRGSFNPLSATKWANTLKQFVGNLAMNCLSVFDHFVELVLKDLAHIKPVFRPTFTCSKSKIEKLAKSVKYVQS